MKVVQIANGRFVQNCYLVADEASRECAVIDPGEDAALIGRTLTDLRLHPVAIWLTHAHIDHVLGVPELKRLAGVPVYLHPADRPLYNRVADQAAAFGMRASPLPPPDRDFAHGDAVRVGDLMFAVRHTPGHSPGSVSLVGSDAVFVGDVLFQGSIGRSDLPGGDSDTLLQSIQRELLCLPDDTIVYSGHGAQTTVGRERATNPFLSGAARLV
jgi:glyoxylase-like metal-dependent hydrolase (beta-lactamase superfamily II)